jgi:hypothetical protein
LGYPHIWTVPLWVGHRTRPTCTLSSNAPLSPGLKRLKDLGHRVMLKAEALGWPRQFPAVGLECVKGLERNPYAAELARVTVWIDEI